MTEKIWVSGHRGDRMHGDENTMRAIRRAVCAGVDMVEIDVRMTKDGGLILMHDATVDRRTDTDVSRILRSPKSAPWTRQFTGPIWKPGRNRQRF